MKKIHTEILFEDESKKITEFICTPSADDNVQAIILDFNNQIQRHAESKGNTFSLFTDVTTALHMILIEEKS